MPRIRFLKPTWWRGDGYGIGDVADVTEADARIAELRGDAQRVTDAVVVSELLPPAPTVEHRDPRPGRRRR